MTNSCVLPPDRRHVIWRSEATGKTMDNRYLVLNTGLHTKMTSVLPSDPQMLLMRGHLPPVQEESDHLPSGQRSPQDGLMNAWQRIDSHVLELDARETL